MQRFTPYIFPLIVLAIVFFLVYRWYNMRSQPTGISTEGIQIENLSESDADSIMRGTGNFETAPLEPAPESTTEVEGVGSIRYEIKDGKVRFSVLADLPKPESSYHVWIRTVGGENLTNAFVLEMVKGGYIGTAAVSQDLLPLEVIVSPASDKAQVMEQVVLKGVVEQEATESVTPAATE